MKTRLSEKEFDTPDSDNPRYSLPEYDFYGHLPARCLKEGEQNHRLSLRKDLKTGLYQIYAHYWRTIRHGEYEDIFYENKSIHAAFRYGNNVACQKWGGDFKTDLELTEDDHSIAKPLIRHGIVGGR